MFIKDIYYFFLPFDQPLFLRDPLLPLDKSLFLPLFLPKTIENIKTDELESHIVFTSLLKFLLYCYLPRAEYTMKI